MVHPRIVRQDRLIAYTFKAWLTPGFSVSACANTGRCGHSSPLTPDAADSDARGQVNFRVSWKVRHAPHLATDPAGPIAQRLEQRTHNPLVPGSNPGGPTKFKFKNIRCSPESSRNSLKTVGIWSSKVQLYPVASVCEVSQAVSRPSAFCLPDSQLPDSHAYRYKASRA